MKRTPLVFVSVLISVSTGLAQSTNYVGTFTETIGLTNQNYNGSAGETAADISRIDVFQSVGSSYQGGSGDSAEATTDGGYGLHLYNDFELVGIPYPLTATVSNSTFRGGAGGRLTGSTLSKTALGGVGLYADFTTSIRGFDSGITAVGGNGGSANGTTGTSKKNISGGTGVHLNSSEVFFGLPKPILGISGGSYTGGNAGTATSESGVIANGGYGMFMNLQNTVVTGGEFTGGNGSAITISGAADQIAASQANGAAGLRVEANAALVLGLPVNGGLTVSDGIFNGGVAGSVNGITGARGAGLQAVSSEIIITGGQFDVDGLGLCLETSQDWLADSTADISGGTFGDIQLKSTTGLQNTISLGGTSSFVDLYLGGEGVNNVSISNSVNSSGIVALTSGTANINKWSDSHFKNTTISEGELSFNNQMFTLQNDSQLTMAEPAAIASFNAGLTVGNGGSLNLGLATATASSVETKSGSQINTTYSGGGTPIGKISSTGALTVGSGTEWVIDAGDNAVAVNQTFDLASGAGVKTVDIAAIDVKFTGTAGEAGWVGGITDLLFVVNDLRATYGESEIDAALGVAGDTSTEFGKAMEDLTLLLPQGSAGYDSIKGIATTAEEGTLLMTEIYVRAPEMASTLIQLQGLFADQIKDRTRSHLRQQNWGGTTASAPQGAQGPGWDSSMDWLNDHLPKWDAREAVKKDNPPKTGKVHSPKAPREKITLPATYQVWGRAYGSTLEQDATTGFAGYKANIGGGVLGLDKRFNNMLLGLGGGYAHTTVDGNWGSDGEADTVYGTVYTAIMGEKTFLDLNVNYAFNDVETEGSPSMQYEGDYKASTASFYLGGGLGLDWGSVLFTPEVSLLTTYYDRESYTETSSNDFYPDKEWDSFSEWSYLSSLGATFSMVRHIESLNLEMEFRPEVRAHWLHEFNAEMDNPTYMMVGGVNTIGVSLQAREEDLIKVGTGVRFAKWNSDTLEFGLDIDGAFGQDYAAYIISGKLMHRF